MHLSAMAKHNVRFISTSQVELVWYRIVEKQKKIRNHITMHRYYSSFDLISSSDSCEKRFVTIIIMQQLARSVVFLPSTWFQIIIYQTFSIIASRIAAEIPHLCPKASKCLCEFDTKYTIFSDVLIIISIL